MVSQISHFSWDPLNDREADGLTEIAKARIKRDLINFFTDIPPGIFIVGDENNLKFVYALIIGPVGTPYEGGFFYFVLKCPNNYPMQPPLVKLLTTDGGKVRFNPNLYENGKICVSILGTWTGPAWSPVQQLSSLLMTIQSLLTEKPYFNEPGHNEEMVRGDSDRYNEIVTYQTLRVAVCGMAENDCHLNIPEPLQAVIKETFLNFYDQYTHIVDEKMHLTGQVIQHPFTHKPILIDYDTIKKRLINIYDKLRTEADGKNSSSDSD